MLSPRPLRAYVEFFDETGWGSDTWRGDTYSSAPKLRCWHPSRAGTSDATTVAENAPGAQQSVELNGERRAEVVLAIPFREVSRNTGMLNSEPPVDVVVPMRKTGDNMSYLTDFKPSNKSTTNRKHENSYRSFHSESYNKKVVLIPAKTSNNKVICNIIPYKHSSGKREEAIQVNIESNIEVRAGNNTREYEEFPPNCMKPRSNTIKKGKLKAGTSIETNRSEVDSIPNDYYGGGIVHKNTEDKGSTMLPYKQEVVLVPSKTELPYVGPSFSRCITKIPACLVSPP